MTARPCADWLTRAQAVHDIRLHTQTLKVVVSCAVQQHTGTDKLTGGCTPPRTRHTITRVRPRHSCHRVHKPSRPASKPCTTSSRLPQTVDFMCFPTDHTTPSKLCLCVPNQPKQCRLCHAVLLLQQQRYHGKQAAASTTAAPTNAPPASSALTQTSENCSCRFIISSVCAGGTSHPECVLFSTLMETDILLRPLPSLCMNLPVLLSPAPASTPLCATLMLVPVAASRLCTAAP